MSLQNYLVRNLIGRPRLRRLVTRLVAGDRDLQINLFGTPLRINSVKENGYLRAHHRIAKSRSLVLNSELAVLINLALLIEDGDTFVDVGANVGLYSCTMARRLAMRPGRNRVYAFEPNPDTFRRLKESSDPLGVVAIQKGVTDRSTTLEFVGGGVSNIFTAADHATRMNILTERVHVECCRLDEVELEGNRFIIKVDVEGQELQVLRGAQRLFEASKVKSVYVDGYENRDVESFLRDRGFTFYDGVTLEPISGGRFNLLALKQD